MQKRSILSIAFLLVMFGLQAQTSFYVSPEGNDQWTGTEKKPFKTIAKAKSAVRLVKDNANADLTVFLKGGTYPISETLVFEPADGGTKELKVTYKAFGNEQPVLSGGEKVSGWKPDTNGIFVTNVQGRNFRQLYVNGNRAIRAREPNAGNYNKLVGWNLRDREVMVYVEQIKNWKNLQQVEMILQMFWNSNVLHIKLFQTYKSSFSQAHIQFADHETDVLFARDFPQKHDNTVYHYENSYEFIDQPNEWYLNNATGELFFKPEKGVDMQTVNIEIPVTETLVNIAETIENPVQNLFFEGLVFEKSNWIKPGNDGIVFKQAGVHFDTRKGGAETRSAAAVAVSYAHNIEFTKNTFRGLGATAFDLVKGTQNCKLTANIIENIAGCGVMVGTFDYLEEDTYKTEPYNPADRRILSNGDRISNNHISKIGCDYYGSCAVVGGFPVALSIDHNVIANTPYSAISVGWGWTNQPTALRDNVIAHNDISNVVNLLCDGGAIYTLSLQPGTQIRGNYIHDLNRSKWSGGWPIAAIYLDEGTGGTEEKPVVLERNSIPIYNSDIKQYNFHREGIILMRNNTIYADEKIIMEAGIEEQFREFFRNKINE